MSQANVREMVEHGFTMRLPATGVRWSPQAAEGLVGTFTEVNAREFGIDETWRMKIVKAEVVDDGAFIVLSLRQPETEITADAIQPVLTKEQEWAEEVIERGTGKRACKRPLMWSGWGTYCVLDAGHDGDCQSYGEVLRLGHKR